MAVESALLGTPSVRVSSLAKSLGNFNELNEKYKLLYYYEDTNEALNKSISILKNKDSRDIWKKRKNILINDKLDTTNFMINFIEEKMS